MTGSPKGPDGPDATPDPDVAEPPAAAALAAGSPRAGGRRRWRSNRLIWVLIAVVAIAVLIWAGGTPSSQRSNESRAHVLAQELKCLQCKGESVAASQAPLAQQFRDEIDRQLDQGASDDQILEWFVDRYGEQVLLDPPTSGLSILVWVLPALLVVGAAGGLWLAISRWKRNPEVARDSPAGSPGTGSADSGEAAGATEAVEPGGNGPDGVDTPPGVAAPPTDTPRTANGSPTRAEPARSRAPRWRIPVVVAGVVVFAGLATWLVVWGSSDRGGGELTGSTGTESGELARCQPLARTDPKAGVECFDKILADDPENIDALTYRGWAHVRAGDLEAGRADLNHAIELDPSAADPHVFLAVAATDEGDFTTAATELQQFWSNDPSDVAVSVVSSEGLEQKVFFGLMSGPTRDCWQSAASGTGDGPLDQAFLDDLGACLDKVLAITPGDRDAKLSRALAYVGPDTSDPAAATALLDDILAENPDDADALSLLVSLELAAGDTDAAGSNLEHLESLPRGSGAFIIGDAATLRAAYDKAADN